MKRAKVALALLLLAEVSFAQDVGRGKLLYETHCVGCHAERLYARPNSKVASIEDLRRQVERWSDQTGRTFTAAEREDLVHFLDTVHYRLELRAPLSPASQAQ